MLDATQILEKIRTGENSGVDFKEVRIGNEKVTDPRRDDLSDDVAAFANHYGGTIIFGVADKPHHIVGIDPSKIRILVTYISEICRDSIVPPVVYFYVDSVQVVDEAGEDKYLVYVEIERSLWLHKSKRGYLYRHGDSNRPMSSEHLLRVGQSRSQARIMPFDEQAVPGTGKDTLQIPLYQRFLREHLSDSEAEEILIKRRLLVKDDKGDLRASVAGVLMCHNKPDDYLYNSFIQAVCYGGKTKDANYQVDAKDFSGTLDQQIVDAFSFVTRHNKVSARKEVGREEKPQYSMRAVFEALVNAVVHRDYSKHGSKIRLFMFADRLEIYSPGELANTLTVDSLPFNQVTRNEILARLLSEIKLEDSMVGRAGRGYFLERRGEGVGIILRESEHLCGKTPIYELQGEELCLTIFAAESY